MKIAISTDGELVSAHFGRCPEFTIVNVEDGKETGRSVVPNPGHQPGAIPHFLHQQGVSCIIAGGMGRRAAQFFEQYQITPVIGVEGKVNDIVKKYLAEELQGGASLCSPGQGKGYGLDKESCDHEEHDH